MSTQSKSLNFLFIVFLVALALLSGCQSSDEGDIELPTRVQPVATNILQPTESKVQITDNNPTPEQVVEQPSVGMHIALADTDTPPTDVPTVTEAPPLSTAEPIVIPPLVEPVPNQVIITFASDATDEDRQSYIESIGGTIQQEIAGLETVVVSVPQTVTQDALPQSDAVTASEPDYYVVALQGETPRVNDPLYPQQWALPVIGAPEAWAAMPADAQQVAVAVIDSGVCLDHPDLVGRILPGYDYVEDDATPQDDFGHGCGVAGIIAANHNDIGIAGVAPNAMILPLRVLDANGLGTYSDVAVAIVYAVDNGAQVINLSLGGVNPSTVLENAINYAIAQDVTVVAAAGNNAQASVLYPAAYEPVIAVGSIDQDLTQSGFSNYGDQIDVWAPGRDIYTTDNGAYSTMSGTSFAVPFVTSVASVLKTRGTKLVTNGGIVQFSITESTDFTATPAPYSTISVSPTPIVQESIEGLPEGYVYVDGDIMIPESYVQLYAQGLYEIKLWPDGVIPYEIHNDLPDKFRVTDAISMWESALSAKYATPLYFVERTELNASQYPHYIIFQKVASGCGTTLGYDSNILAKPVNLADGCTTGNTAHEIGHVLGLHHEHKRSDRNDYVEVIFDNIIDDKESQFRIEYFATEYGEYDFDSLMHYSENAFVEPGCVADPSSCPHNGVAIRIKDPYAQDPNISIGQRDHISDIDTDTIIYLYDTKIRDVTTYSSLVLGQWGQIRVSVRAPNDGNYHVRLYDGDLSSPSWSIDPSKSRLRQLTALGTTTYTFDVLPDTISNDFEVWLYKQTAIPFVYDIIDKVAFSLTAFDQSTCKALSLSHSGSGNPPTADPVKSPNCPVGEYYDGTSVALTAYPASGYRVAGWSDTNNDSSTSTTNTVTMNSAKNVSVTYEEIPEDTYSISGRVTVSGSGLDGVEVAVEGYPPVDTAGGGYFTVSGVVDGTYGVTASELGYTFNSQTVTVSGFDRTGINLVGSVQTANTYTFYPTEDTYIREGYPDLSYGTLTSFRAGREGPGAIYGFVRFGDVASTLSGKTVYSAELQAYVYNIDGGNTRLTLAEVDHVEVAWYNYESTVTYNTFGILGDFVPFKTSYLGSTAGSRSIDATGWYTWTLPDSWVQGWIDGANKGVAWKPYYSNIYEAPYFSSRTGTNPPVLTVRVLNGTPDLVVSDIYTDPDANASMQYGLGDSVQLYWTISNIGPGDSDSGRAAAYIGADPGNRNTWTYIDDDGMRQLLSGDSSALNWVPYAFNSTGTYYFIVEADCDYNGSSCDYELSETNENNNISYYGPFEVIAPNQSPQWSPLLPDKSLSEDGSIDNAIDLHAYVSDETADANLTFVIFNNVNALAGVSLDSNRYIDINPAPNWNGYVDVTIKVYDEEGASSTDTFRVTVNVVNDEPWISPVIPDQEAEMDEVVVLDLAGYKHDLEDSGADLTWSVTGLTNASVQIAGDVLTFTPNNDFEGDVSPTIHLIDSGELEATQAVMFTWRTDSPEYSAWEQSPADVTEHTVGAVRVTVTVTDPLGSPLPSAPQFDYHVNSTYDGYESMTLLSGNTWYFDIPSADWDALQGQTLYYRVTATSEMGYTSVSDEQSDYIDPVNDGPDIVTTSPSASNVIVLPPNCQTFGVTVQDDENDELTYIWYFDDLQKTTTTTYQYCATDYDVHTVQVTVSDGALSASHTWNVIADNQAPTTLLAPTGTRTDGYGNPTYVWTGRSIATAFDLLVQTATGATVVNENLATTTYCEFSYCEIEPVSALGNEAYRLTNGNYVVRMRNYVDGSPGDWEGPWSFTLAATPPAAVTLESVTDVDSVKPTLNWLLYDTAANSTHFRIYVANQANGAVVYDQQHTRISTCGDADGITCSFRLPVTLGDETAYDVYVQSFGPGGAGNWAGPANFTISLAKVQITGPIGTITTGYGDPVYTWIGIEDADFYYLYVGNTSGQVINEVIDAAGYCDGLNCVVDPTSFNENYRLLNGNYQIYVRPWSSSDGPGAWVGPVYFTLDAPLPGDITMGTITETDTSNPTIHWSLSNTATYATWFNIYVAPATGGDPVHYEWHSRSSVCGDVDGTTCSFQLPEQLADTTLFNVYIQSYGPGGIGSWVGPTRLFVDIPTTLSPYNVEVNPGQGFPSLSWIPGDDASEWFEVKISGPVSYQQWHSRVDVCNEETGTCELQPNIILTSGTYTVSVRAWGPGGYSDWVPALDDGLTYFTVETSPTGIVTGQNVLNANTGNPQLIWNVVENGTWYRLYVTGPTGLVHDIWHNVQSIGCSEGSQCEVTLTGLANGAYDWYVQAYGAGGLGQWTEKATFLVNAVIPKTPTAQSPIASVTLDTAYPLFIWNHVDDAVYYEFWLGTSNPSTQIHYQTYAWEDDGMLSGPLVCGEICTLALDGLSLENDSYVWYVRAHSPAGASGWVGGMYFNVYIPPPSSVTLDMPLDDQVIYETNRPTFVWQETTYATYYQLELLNGMGTALLNTWYESNTICSAGWCSLQIPDPIPYGGYAWKVRAYSQGGNDGIGPWSTLRYFTSLSINTVPMAVQADDSLISTTGSWTRNTSERAMADDYLVGRAGDTEAALELTFEGTSVDVLYVAGPEFGSFVIEVDAVIVQTVHTYSETIVYGQLAHVGGLTVSPHKLRIISADGSSIAIDAIIVGGQVIAGTDPIIIPTVEPTVTVGSTVTKEPTAIIILTATPELTIEPSDVAETTKEPQPTPIVIPSATTEPTTAVTSTPVPTEEAVVISTATPEPILAPTVDSFDDNGRWIAEGAWTHDTAGQWILDSSNRVESILTSEYGFDFSNLASPEMTVSLSADVSATDSIAIEVLASNMNTWTPIYQLRDATLDWQSLTFDLSSYAGQTIELRFRYIPSGDTFDGAWWLDSIDIHEKPPLPTDTG